MNVMILAAGRGERLRPLTDSIPKPLVEVGGQTLLGRHMERLVAAGFNRAIINVSHLAQLITARFGNGREAMAIDWSHEDVPLETAGGIALARKLLGPEPFLLVNSDIWCDYEFSKLHGFDLGGRLSHLVLVPNPAQHPRGDFSLQHGEVGELEQALLTYSGIGVYRPELFAGCLPGRFPLLPLLRKALAAQRLQGEPYLGQWTDIGTVARLAALNSAAGVS